MKGKGKTRYWPDHGDYVLVIEMHIMNGEQKVSDLMKTVHEGSCCSRDGIPANLTLGFPGDRDGFPGDRDSASPTGFATKGLPYEF